MPEFHFLDTGVTFRYKGSFALGLKKKKKRKGRKQSNEGGGLEARASA